ncbi:MAG TPA: GAF domain-containing SpoIIE family protein phosphatase [Gemmatimonadaceae bacterium]|jgi:sigma-B regulation protein RsbU (phosphoserine phosphatase)|nr:GAF domain-containing SpoIIE family protein phosphatase [Gemmatimonadaceae bacterium]
MTDLAQVLGAFFDATRCDVGVWMRSESASATATPVLVAGTRGAAAPASFPDVNAGERAVGSPRGELLVAAVPGPRIVWLVVGPSPSPGLDLRKQMGFLLPVVAQYMQSALEVEHAANELAERYEEINLLYTISEILGRTVALDEATKTILSEVSETVGARRASVLVHDRVTNTLRAVAALGVDTNTVPPVDVDDPFCVSARVFRTQHPMLAEPDEMVCGAESGYRRGAMLSVPIMWTAPAPRGAEPLGVVNLSDRRSGQPFTAGDQKLIAAIATQIGTAIQNTRLVRASVEQQRLAHEMQLAHDLQMKLLPNNAIVAPEATVAARVVPAESVGGDFYNLFRLGSSKTGVMIGDVSGHGYQAALIMALTMSATAIHSQSTIDPGEVLFALMGTLRDELTMTEMFISAFYAVVDVSACELWYANTGHPHAFLLAEGKNFERLAAKDLPLGMDERQPATERRPWKAGRDLLVLFTDGISDARNRAGERLGEERVLDTIRAHRTESPQEILGHVFEILDAHTAGATRRDDLTIVLLRS